MRLINKFKNQKEIFIKLRLLINKMRIRNIELKVEKFKSWLMKMVKEFWNKGICKKRLMDFFLNGM